MNPSPHRRLQRGFTLVELVLVTLLLAIFAALAVPALQPVVPYELDLAAREVADALEFARAESLRTGNPHGVTVDASAERIRVWRADMSASPVVPAATLYHPVDRQPWDRVFGSAGLPPVDITTTAPFDFPGHGTRAEVLFDATGAPVWVVNPGGTVFELGSGVVGLGRLGQTGSVALAPVLGRVKTQ